MTVIRWILSPFALILWGFAHIRNFSYQLNWKKGYQIPGKSIGIGNLNLGGSGKSPLTLFLLEYLQTHYPISVLSRGYGRKTKGFIRVLDTHQAHEVGDEPLMYAQHASSKTQVYVSEDRKEGLLQMKWPHDGVLLLDDVFQHRKVIPGLSLVVSDFSKPFFEDYMFPLGWLREPRIGIKRAQAIVITKCPVSIDENKRAYFKQKLAAFKLPYFFSSLEYSPLFAAGSIRVENPKHAIVVTGIANPKPLIDHLESQFTLSIFSFSDHHVFNEKELSNIHKKFNTFDVLKTIIITTEKDFMRIKGTHLEQITTAYPWYIQPIKMTFEQPEAFHQLINDYVK